jgi:pimeloyl-ACP methyl ester carboxylesterase
MGFRAEAAMAGERVILVHGLWMPALALLPLQRRLAARAFRVERFAYPSGWRGLAPNLAALARRVADLAEEPVHLVGHSLGGLLILSLLARDEGARIGRVVLMGSPCMGSHCAATLLARPWLAPLVGPTLAQWLAGPRPALPPGVEVGLIAGTRSLGVGRLFPGLPRPNDGVVALAETTLPGARDRVILDVNHSGMLLSRACVAQVASFLANGRFLPPAQG